MVENTSIKFDYIFSINNAQYTSLIQILLKQNKILEKKKEQPLPSYYYSSVNIWTSV